MYSDEESQIDRLESIFADMRDGGWDTASELLWGYFFLDDNQAKLEKLRQELQRLGYVFVEIFDLDDAGNEASSGKTLHVEKIETHSPSTLAKRNVELSQLAAEFAVEDYDGWDVGQVEVNH